jgi:hypothetical protein
MQQTCSESKRLVVAVTIASLALVSIGCGNPAEMAVKQGYSPSADKDVSASPEYHFALFANTVWKTKAKTEIANVKRYTGATDTMLLTRRRFDPTDPDYVPATDMGPQVIAVLPPGTRLRITRLMHDEGVAGFVNVEAVLLDEPYAQKTVLLDGYFLTGNAWSRGPTSNATWDADPNMLEKP